MGNRVVTFSDPSLGTPARYKFGERTINAQDHGFKKVEFDCKHFDEGKFRLAYRGKVFVDENKKDAQVDQRRLLNCWVVQRDAGKPYYECIVKQFKRSHAQKAAEWDNDLSVLEKADALARKFNKDVRRTPHIQIEFASAFLYQVYQPGAEYQRTGWFSTTTTKVANASVLNQEKVCVEPFFKGKFVKANCNNGYVGKAIDLQFHETAQAFSHWTWFVTGGELLVCDLQGVQREGCWQFTDPAIHDAAGGQRFGCTDLGPRGINAFFCTHKCNSICQGFAKPETVVDVGLPGHVANVGSTTFSWELARVSSEVHSQQDFADILDHAHSGTCYAQAMATMLRHAERRIVGRTPERHHVIATRIVQKYGTKGGSLVPVLNQECPPKQLRWHFVTSEEAAACLQVGRAMLCSFCLTNSQWASFSEFFRRSPSGILSELPDACKDVVSGHGCVLIGQDKNTWKIKNSWGDDFADGGYFRICKALLSRLEAHFVDIYFVVPDLLPEDFLAYDEWCLNSNLRTVDAQT